MYLSRGRMIIQRNPHLATSSGFSKLFLDRWTLLYVYHWEREREKESHSAQKCTLLYLGCFLTPIKIWGLRLSWWFKFFCLKAVGLRGCWFFFPVCRLQDPGVDRGTEAAKAATSKKATTTGTWKKRKGQGVQFANFDHQCFSFSHDLILAL